MKTPQNLIDALSLELKNKSYARLAEACGVSGSLLHNYVAGSAEPSTDNLRKLADYFGVDIEYLRGEGVYRNLSGDNRLDVARRLHRDEREKAIFQNFVTTRVIEIETGRKRSNQAHIKFTEQMAELRSIQRAEYDHAFKSLEQALDRIPEGLRLDAIQKLIEKIK